MLNLFRKNKKNISNRKEYQELIKENEELKFYNKFYELRSWNYSCEIIDNDIIDYKLRVDKLIKNDFILITSIINKNRTNSNIELYARNKNGKY